MNDSVRRVSSFRTVRGFTLVELQIAMVIMTMIAMLMAGALRATVQTWGKTTEHQDLSEHRFLVDQFLRRHLNNMRFYRARLPEGRRPVSFMGGKRQLHFVAPFPNFVNDGELYWWTLKNQAAEDGLSEQLVLEYLPFSSRQVIDYDPGKGLLIDDAEPASIVVDSDLRLESLEYFDQDELGIDDWRSDWEPGDRAPKVVALQILDVNVEDDEEALTRMVIAPRFYHQRLIHQADD